MRPTSLASAFTLDPGKESCTGLTSLVICLLAVLITATAGCNPGDGSKTKRLILLTNGDDPFWDAMREGMVRAEADLNLAAKNLKVVMEKNDATANGQVEKLRQYLAQTDVAAVGISVIDPNNAAMAEAMRALRQQGVVVLTIDSDVNRERFKDTRFAYLGTENVLGGRQMGLAARRLNPQSREYATFYGFEGVANVVERNRGFAEGAGEGFTRVAGMSDSMKTEVAQDNVRNALENHPNIGTLVGIWAYDAHAIVSVVKERGIRDQVKIVVFDAAPKALAHLKDGFIDAMVVQNPFEMGYQGVRLMNALLENDTSTIRELYPAYDGQNGFTSADGDIHHTSLRVVVPEDSPLRPEDFDEFVEFYTIDEFDQWLDERGLIGS